MSISPEDGEVWQRNGEAINELAQGFETPDEEIVEEVEVAPPRGVLDEIREPGARD